MQTGEKDNSALGSPLCFTAHLNKSLMWFPIQYYELYYTEHHGTMLRTCGLIPADSQTDHLFTYSTPAHSTSLVRGTGLKESKCENA